MSDDNAFHADIVKNDRRPCPMCGEDISVNARRCRFCGDEFDAELSAREPNRVDEGVKTLIPYQNPPALIAYYLGLFSLIPCFPIGIAAFVLGIIGLRKVHANPSVHGTVHAWIGIVLGFLFGGLWTLITIGSIIVAAIGPQH